MFNQSIMLVLSEPVPGREREYNDWYNDVHLPQVLEIDGIEWAARFDHEETHLRWRQSRFVAIYGVSHGHEHSAMEELRAKTTSKEIPIDASMEVTTLSAGLFKLRTLQQHTPSIYNNPFAPAAS